MNKDEALNVIIQALNTVKATMQEHEVITEAFQVISQLEEPKGKEE